MGNPPRISSLRSLRCSFFSSSFLRIVWCYFWKYVESIFSIILAAGFRKKLKHGNTVRVKIIFSLLRVVVQNWNFDLSAGNLTGKLINLGFPQLKTNSKPDFRGKRQGFDGKKPNWNALWRNMSHDITGHKQTRLRSQTHSKLLLYLNFRSYFEAASPNCFNVFL